MVIATSLYAGILALICFALAAGVGQVRGKSGISLGDGGDKGLLTVMRRHMNFVEFVPLILVLMALIELNGAPKSWLHGLGGALVAARLIHPFSLDPDHLMKWSRFAGAMGTMLVLLACGLILLWQTLAGS
ncbi:MAG: MAPEG family protein [Novosphingobium sp.]